MELPRYYSSFGPFRATFQSGLAVLTYHHVGPCPRGARIKGLYVSPKLFEQQLSELRKEGYSSTSLGAIGVKGSDPDRRFFVTFDDGFRDVFDHGLPILRRQASCGIIFLVSDLLGKTNEWQQRVGDVSMPLMDDHQVRDWLAAGQQIGSHTRTHPRLTQLTLAEAREQIVASRKLLEDRFAVSVDHFCYPYGDWNPAVRDLVIEAGYQTACTTDTGVNTHDTSLHELKRFTARYPSRNLRAVWKRLWT
jgi:peptidoglycan/xylan/chitin deacetylase (PgdA/CDA1 family)